MNFVLDTNIVIYELSGKLAEPLPPGPYAVSIITEIELLAYQSLDDAEEREIKRFLESVAVIELTPAVRDETIALRRLHRLKLPDAIVAATSVTLDVELLTSDQRLANTHGLRSRLISVTP